MKKTWILAVSAITLAACSDTDDSVNPDVPAKDKGYTEVFAYLPDTRTYLTGTNTTNHIYWSKNDEISVWSDEIQTATTFKITEGANSGSAKFAIKNENATEGVRGNDFYAVYPAMSANGETATFSMPNSQTLQKMAGENNIYSFPTRINPMAATGTADPEDRTIKLQNFTSLCAILDIAIIPDIDLHVNSIEIFTRGNKALCGTATIAWNDNIPSLNITDNAGYTLTLGVENNPVIKAGVETHFYAVVPASTYPNMQISIYTPEVGGGFDATLLKRRSVSMVLAPNKITNVGASFVIKTIKPTPYKVGDVYPHDYKEVGKSAVGIVFQVAADGLSGKVCATQNITGTYAWVTEDYSSQMTANTFGIALDENNGLVNLQAAESKNLLDKLPAFKACASYTVGGLKWYLPAIDELQSMGGNLSTYNKLNVTWGNLGNSGWFMPEDNYWSSYVAFGRGGKPSIYYSSLSGDIFISNNQTNSTTQYAVIPVAQFEVK